MSCHPLNLCLKATNVKFCMLSQHKSFHNTFCLFCFLLFFFSVILTLYIPKLTGWLGEVVYGLWTSGLYKLGVITSLSTILRHSRALRCSKKKWSQDQYVRVCFCQLAPSYSSDFKFSQSVKRPDIPPKVRFVVYKHQTDTIRSFSNLCKSKLV